MDDKYAHKITDRYSTDVEEGRPEQASGSRLDENDREVIAAPSSTSVVETDDSMLESFMDHLDAIPTIPSEPSTVAESAQTNEALLNPLGALESESTDSLTIDVNLDTIEPPPVLSPNEELTLLAVKLKPNSPDRDDDVPINPPGPSHVEKNFSREGDVESIPSPSVVERDTVGTAFMEEVSTVPSSGIPKEEAVLSPALSPSPPASPAERQEYADRLAKSRARRPQPSPGDTPHVGAMAVARESVTDGESQFQSQGLNDSARASGRSRTSGASSSTLHDDTAAKGRARRQHIATIPVGPLPPSTTSMETEDLKGSGIYRAKAARPGAMPVDGPQRAATKFTNLNESRRRPVSTDADAVATSGPSIGQEEAGTLSKQEPLSPLELAPPHASFESDAAESDVIDSPRETELSPPDRPQINHVSSAHLVEAQIYNAEAEREEVRRQAEMEAEQRLLADAIVAEAKVIEDEDEEANWCLYCGICCIVVIVAVVVAIVVSGDDSSSGTKHNDRCSTAFRLDNFTGGLVEGEIRRNVEGSLGESCQVQFGEGYALWYYLNGEGNRLSASTCEGTDLGADSDTQVLVFSGSCNELECVGGSDELCGAHGSVGWLAEEDTKYFVVVKGFRTSNAGAFTLTMETLEENDTCDTASQLDLTESITFGSTRNATFDGGDMNCGDAGAVSPGSWYRFEGDGNVVCTSASSDQGVTPTFPVQFSILEGNDCSALTCVDDGAPSITEPWKTDGTAFLAEEGSSYFVVLRGDEVDATGDFLLNTFETPSNGICETAEEVAVGDTTPGTMKNACNQGYVDCPEVLDREGVWYSVVGTGNLIIAEARGLSCMNNRGNTVSRISIFSGGSGCGDLACTAFEVVECTAGNEKTISQWFSKPGELYYVLVQSSDLSDFELSISDFTPVVTDKCENGTAMNASGDYILGSTVGATVDDVGACDSSDTPGVWYWVNGTGQSLVASTCQAGTNYTTEVTIMAGTCGQLECVEATSISCDGVRNMVFWESVPGQMYAIYVHGKPGKFPETGRFSLVVDEDKYEVSNDYCGTAMRLDIPSITLNSTEKASEDNVDLCGLEETAPGVWYSIVGDDKDVTASLCGEATDYDTQIFVYSGACEELVCLQSNDDACNKQSEVTWFAEQDVEYFILVSGFGSAVGTFELDIRNA